MSAANDISTNDPTRPGAGRRRRALWLGATCVLGVGVALGVVLSLTGSGTQQAAQQPRQAQPPVVQPSTTPQPTGAARLAAADRWLRDALGAKPATGPKTTPSVAAAHVGKITPVVVQTLPRNVRVTLDAAGYTVARGTGKVRVASTGIAGAGAWSAYANGMTRTTATGAETVVVRGERTELYTRVDTPQGVRTWTWRIESDLTPQLQANGDILWRGSTALVTHAPRIVKLDGSDITPAGSRWKLQQVTGGWQLGLRLDDSSLPAPYLIDPDTSAPSQYFDTIMNDLPFRQTTLNGAINNSTTTVVVASATGWPSSGQYLIQIDNEVMRVTAGQGTTSWTVVRAVGGSSAASHLTSATVSGQGGYWRMDQANTGNSNTTCPITTTAITDSSGYGKSLEPRPTSSSAPVCARAGAISETTFGASSETAILFETAKNNFLRLNSATTGLAGNYAFTGNAPFSLEAWIKPSAAPGSGVTTTLIQRQGNSGGSQGWRLVISDTALTLQRYLSGAAEGASLGAFQGGSVIQTGTWYHVVGVYDPSVGSNQLKLYVNGVLRAQGTATQALLDSFSQSLAIGGTSGIPFPGDLDEVAIYPLALGCGTTTLNASCTGGSQIGTHYARGLDAGITASESGAATHVLSATDATTTATPNPAVVWYRPGQSGTFTVASAATDTIDGTTRGAATSVSSVLFQTASLPTGLTGGGTDSSAPYAGAYTWSASLSGDQLVNVTVNNNNALSAVSQYQLKSDSSAPSGSSISYADGNNLTGSVALTLVNGTDGAGSGVDAASPILERASATLTNGTCGSFGAFASIGVTATDATVANANCYKYQYKVSDNVANQATSTSANVVKVDTVNPANGLALSSISPAGSASLSGTTVFYRGSGGGSGGSFTLTNTVTDNGSGPASSTFDNLGGTTTGWTFTGSTVSTPSGGPYVSTAVAWAEGTTTSPTLAVTATDGAGRTNTATTLTLANDPTAPFTAITAPTATSFNSGTYSSAWSGTASESGSGFASVAVSTRDTTSNLYWNGAAFASGSEVMNAATGTTSWTYSGPAAGNLTVGRSYLVTLKVTDNVGNTGTSTVTFSYASSGTAPDAPTSLAPAASAVVGTTTPTLSATFTDPDPGDTGKLTFRVCSDSGCSSVIGTQDGTPTGLAAAGATGSLTVPVGFGLGNGTTYFWQVRSEDALGHTSAFTPASPRAFTVDTTRPTQTVTATQVSGNAFKSGTTVFYRGSASGRVTVTSTVTDANAASATFGTLGGTTGGFTFGGSTVTTPSGGPYVSGNLDWAASTSNTPTLAVTAADAAGNTTLAATTLTFTNDSTAPTAAVTTPADGTAWNASTWGALGSIGGTSTDGAGANVAQVQVSIRAGAGNYWNGVAFASAGEVLATATGTGSWTLAAPGAGTLVDGVTYTIRVVTTDNVNNSSSLSTTFVYDTTAPSLGLTFPAASTAYNGTGWAAGCASAGACGTSADAAGSGVANVEVSLQRQSDTKWWNGSSFVVSGSELFTTATGAATWSLPIAIGSLTEGDYVVRARAADSASNRTTGSTRTFTIDTLAPAAPTITSSESSADSHQLGSTFTYRPAGAGAAFTVTAVTSDIGGSGVQKVTFPGLTGGITPASDQDDTSSPFSLAYTWHTSDTTAGGKTITAVDNAGNTATGTLTIVRDSTTPNGQSISLTAVPGSGFYATASVAVTLGDGSDAEAGLDSSTRLIQRERAPLTGGTCGTFDGSFTTVTSPDTSMTLSGCYRYRFTIADNVGNVSSPVTSAAAKVDLDTPAVPSLTLSEQPASADQHVSGSTLFYRPTTAGGAGGTFRVTAAASDTESGVKQVDFSAIAGLTRVGSGTDTSAPYSEDYTWGAGAPTGSQSVAAVTDNALRAGSAASITLTADSTAPTTTDNSASFSAWQSAPVTVTLTPGDGGGAGVAATYYTTDGSTPTTGSTQGTAVALPATGQYTVKYFSVDNVGNAEAVKTAGTLVRVDRAVPTDTPAVISESPADSAFKSGATVWYRGSAGGSLALQNTVTDSDSGPASTTFGALGSTTGGWTFSGSTVGGGSPYVSNTLTYGAATTSSPTVLVTSADAAGNASAGTTLTFQDDSAAPTGGSVTYNSGVFTSTTPTVAFDLGTDAGSAVKSGQLQRASATLTGSTCGAYGAFTNTGAAQIANGSLGESGLVAGNCYKWRLVVSDNVGNSTIVTSANEYKVDTATPYVVGTVGGAGALAVVTGSTVWVKPGGGTFTLQVKSAQQANYTSIDYPAGPGAGLTGTSASPGSAPFNSSTYTWSAPFAGPATLATTAHLNPSGTSPESIDVQADSTAPTTTDNAPGACQGTDVIVTLTRADGQSGVSATYFTTDGTTPTTSSTAGTSVALTASGTTTVKYFSVDRVGNAEAVKTASVCIDKAVPTNALSLTAVSPAGSAVISGTSVFYNASAGGSLELRNTVDGTGTAAASSSTGALSSGAAGWSHAPSTVSAPGGGPYDSNDLTWNTAATTVTVGVASTDAVGNTSATTTITFTPDSTLPTITDATPLSTPRANGGAIGLSASDSPAGVAHTYWTIDGSSPLTPGTRTDSTSVAVPDVEGTYTVKFAAVDNVGNASAITTRTIVVDKTKPSVATLTALPATISTGQALTGTGTDALSGVASITYAYCAGTGQDPATCTATTIGSSSSGPSYSVAWSSQPTDGAYTVFARVADGVGNVQASAGRNVTVDNTAPTVSITSPAGGSYVNLSVSNPSAIAATASADTTGVEFFQCSNTTASCTGGSWNSLGTDSAAPFSGAWTLPADGQRALRAVATDGAAHTATSIVNAIVDRTAPFGVLTAPAAGTVSDAVALTATSSDTDLVGIQFQARSTPAGSFANVGAQVTSAPFTTTWTTGPSSGVNDGSYAVQAVITDLAGNSVTVGPNAVTVSNLPKALLTAQVGSLGTPLALQYNGQLDGTSVPAPSAYAVTVNGVPRTVTGVTITFDTVRLAVSPAITYSDTNVQVSYTVPGSSPARDLLGVPVIALSGQLVTNSSTAGLAPPVLVSATPADGSVIATSGLASGTITYTADKVVTWSNVAFLVPPGAPAAPVFSAPLGTTATATYGSTVAGEYQFTATLSDGVNPAVNVAVHFTIAVPAGSSTQPATSKSADPTTPTGQLGSSDAASSVAWQAGTFSVPSIVSIHPVISTPAAGEVRPTTVFGLLTSITTSAIEVTATTLADGTKVTSFPWATPLEIVFAGTSADSAPSRSSDGGLTYSGIRLIPGPTLPAGYVDGYWFDAATGKLHILTTHLTIFAVQRDTQPPSAPRSLSGVIAGDGLTLRWEPASDNSGAIAHYHLFINGERIQTFGSVTFEGKLGPYTPGDTRVFQVRADDSRANLGESSNAVTLLPDVSGLTPATARGVLIRSGLSIGATTEVASSAPAGTIVRTTPAYPAVVVVGGTVGLAVSNGTGSTGTTGTTGPTGTAAGAPLALKVAGAKRVALRQRKSVALRVVVSVPARTTITMRSASGKAIASWTRSLRAGATIVTVALPPAARRAGTYRFTVAARPTGAPSAKVIARTTIVNFAPTPTPVGKAVDVVLVNGPAVRLGSSLNLPAKATVQSVPKGPDVYDVSGTKAANVQVVVVDLDTNGIDAVHLIRNLRAVYPDLRIVALASSPGQVEKARREGATIVLTKPVSVEILSSVVTDLIPTTTPATRVTAAVSTSNQRPRTK